MPLIAAAVSPRDWDSFGARQARSLGLGGAEFFPWLLREMDDINDRALTRTAPATDAPRRQRATAHAPAGRGHPLQSGVPVQPADCRLSVGLARTRAACSVR